MKNFLITTGLKSSWKLSNKNYYLNYYNIFNSNNNIKKKKFIYSDPYGIKLENKIKNEKFINKLCKEILNDLSRELNKYHNTSFQTKYWKIITGNNVKRIIKIIYFRFKSLEKVINSKKNLYTTASKIDDYILSVSESKYLDDACLDDEWNFNLISNILRISFKNKINLYNYKTKNFYFIEKSLEKKNFFYNFLINIINTFSNTFNKRKDYFIYDSFLPKFAELKLNFYLSQLPIFRTTYRKINVPEKYNLKKRKELNLNKNRVSEVERVIRVLLPKILPMCYLENYSKIKKNIKFLKWPDNPKAIITANAYDYDEIFKIWAASKICNGSKYYIFQHGSLHSNHLIKENQNEYDVCDKFFYWGSKFKNKKGIKAFNFKLLKNNNLSKKNNILVICKSRGYENETYDRSYEHKIIFDNLKEFINFLPKKILKKTYFRVKDILENNIEKNYLNTKNLNILDPRKNIFKYIKQSALVIYFYNSTGIYENLSLNVPTMFYWADSKNNQNSQNNDFIKFCKKNKIFHESVESLQKELILKHESIDSWWNDKKLQKQRQQICNKYSILPDEKKLKELSKIIKHAKYK